MLFLQSYFSLFEFVLKLIYNQYVRSSELGGHVMFGDPLLIHLAGNCSSENVQKNFGKVLWSPSDFFLWEFVKDKVSGHQYVIWENYMKQFMQLSAMQHHKCVITHGSKL